MKGANPQGGFTIVETLIVLTVTGSLFASAMGLISGQQARTEFNQGIREAHGQIQDILNDVTTGYYASTGTFQCTAGASGAPVIISGGSKTLGQNYGCTFIGKALQFNPDGNANNYNIYTVVGRQFANGSTSSSAENITEALPIAMALSSAVGGSGYKSTVSNTLPYGLKIGKMEYIDGSSSKNIGSVGFISSLSRVIGSGNSPGAVQAVDLVPIPGTSLTIRNSSGEAVAQINGLRNNGKVREVTSVNTADALPINPDGGVILYILSSGGDRCGRITIGGKGNGQLSSKLDIVDASTCT